MSQMATYARRFGVIGGAGTVYVGAVYMGVQLYGDRGEAHLPTEAGQGCGCPSHSYVHDPHRNQTYQKIAHVYDSQIEKDELVMGIHLMRRALLYFHAKGEVLEVGAGTGRNLGYYPDKSTVSRVTLTDIGDKTLLQAKEKIQKMSLAERSRYDVVVADAADLQYPDAAFDTVVDSFGLCSFDDPVAVLRELQRVCKPNGRILLLEHGRSKTWEGLTRYLDKYAERHARNWGCCWNRDIDRIVADAGLEVERQKLFHFGTTYYLVCKPRTGGGEVVAPGGGAPRANEDDGRKDTVAGKDEGARRQRAAQTSTEAPQRTRRWWWPF